MAKLLCWYTSLHAHTHTHGHSNGSLGEPFALSGAKYQFNVLMGFILFLLLFSVLLSGKFGNFVGTEMSMINAGEKVLFFASFFRNAVC